MTPSLGDHMFSSMSLTSSTVPGQTVGVGVEEEDAATLPWELEKAAAGG